MCASWTVLLCLRSLHLAPCRRRRFSSPSEEFLNCEPIGGYFAGQVCLLQASPGSFWGGGLRVHIAKVAARFAAGSSAKCNHLVDKLAFVPFRQGRFENSVGFTVSRGYSGFWRNFENFLFCSLSFQSCFLYLFSSLSHLFFPLLCLICRSLSLNVCPPLFLSNTLHWCDLRRLQRGSQHDKMQFARRGQGSHLCDLELYPWHLYEHFLKQLYHSIIGFPDESASVVFFSSSAKIPLVSISIPTQLSFTSSQLCYGITNASNTLLWLSLYMPRTDYACWCIFWPLAGNLLFMRSR